MSNMVVRTNVFALNAHRNLKNVGVDQARASNRLASGYRINTAADDAAGLAISEAMRAQIRGLDQASRNAQDGQALINTAEGGMQEIHNMLQRIRELTVQAANDTNTEDNRAAHIALEIDQLLQEITDMANRVQYNGMTLLNGDFARGADRYQFTIDVTQLNGAVAGTAGVGTVDSFLPGNVASITDDFTDAQIATLNRFLSSVEFSNIISAVESGSRTAIEAINFVDHPVPRPDLIMLGIDDLNSDLRSLVGLGVTGSSGFNSVDDLQGFLRAVVNQATDVVVAKDVTVGDVAAALAGQTPAAVPAATGANATLGALGAVEGISDQALTALVNWMNEIGGASGSLGDPEVMRAHGAATGSVSAATHIDGDRLLALQYAGVISSAAHGQGIFEDADAMATWFNTNSTAMQNLRDTLFGSTPVDGITAEVSQGVDRLAFQVGANSGQLMRTSIADMRMVGDTGIPPQHSLGHAMQDFVNGWRSAFESDNADQISAMIDPIHTGIEFVSLARAELGAVSNRLDFTSRSLDISSENLSDAESRVRNADMAREMMRFTMANVLQQASVSMLAQANQMPNNLLQLLR